MRNRSLYRGVLTGVALCLAAVCGPAQSMDDLRRELQDLRAELDSLRQAQALNIASDDLDRFDDRIDKRMRALEAKIDAVARSSSVVAFNPRTTAFLNFAGRVDDRIVFDEQGVAQIQDRPFVRTVEVDMRAAVDPYSEAVIILSLEDEAGTGYSIDPEEAYGVLKRLPLLESAPAGLKLKVGKFRAPLGEDNKLHMHDLPWITRPLVIASFLGTEHGNFFESGFNPIGVDADFFLPTLVPGSTWEMNISAVRGGELALTQGHGGSQPAWIGHLNASADWNNEHLLVLGASGYWDGGKSTVTALGGLDVLYKWAPSERRDSRSFVAGGEVFLGHHEYPNSSGGTTTADPLGWFAYLQYQVSYAWYLGCRWDAVESPASPSLSTRAASAYVSYYTTEFLRFRVGVEHRWSDIASSNDLTTGLFEVNFVFGSHPTEPYWVNR